MALPSAIKHVRSSIRLYTGDSIVDYLWLSGYLTQSWMAAGAKEISIEQSNGFVILSIKDRKQTDIDIKSSAVYMTSHRSWPKPKTHESISIVHFHCEILVSALAERCIIRQDGTFWEVVDDYIKEISGSALRTDFPHVNKDKDFIIFSKTLRNLPGYNIV